jgi:hypothetical protein
LINGKNGHERTTCKLEKLEEVVSGKFRDPQVITDYATEEVNRKNTTIKLKAFHDFIAEIINRKISSLYTDFYVYHKALLEMAEIDSLVQCFEDLFPVLSKIGQQKHETNQIWTRKPDRYHVDFLVLQLVAADLLETGVDLSRGRDRDGDGDDNSADEVFVKIAYERDHDTTRSVDVDTNWDELFLVLL